MLTHYPMDNLAKNIASIIDHGLKSQIIMKNEIIDLRDHLNHTITTFEKTQTIVSLFDYEEFLRDKTVEYLKTHYLNRSARCKLLLSLNELDISCVLYLLDCYKNGIYRWNEVFLVNNELRKAINLICMCGSTETITVLLNMVMDGKEIFLETNTDGIPIMIHFICKYQQPVSVNRILDIYLEKEFNLECVTDHGSTPFHLICCYQNSQLVNRMLDIYLEKGLDLKKQNKNGDTPIDLIFKHQSSLKTRVLKIYAEKYKRVGLIPMVIKGYVPLTTLFTWKTMSFESETISTPIQDNDKISLLDSKKCT